MRYIELRLVEGYKEVAQRFSQEAEAEQVKKAIAQYRELVNRNQVQGNERNIDWWGKQGWEQFRTFVNAKSQQQSQTQQKKRSASGQSHTLAETDQWLIVVPLDKDASCFHGKDTDWCTTKPTQPYFEQYFRDNSVTLIYFLQKQTGNKWAIAVYDEESDNAGEVADYFDKQDNEIGQTQFDRQTGLQSKKYINMVHTDSTTQDKVGSARAQMQQDKRALEKLIQNFYDSYLPRDPRIETLLIKTKDSDQLHAYLMNLREIHNRKPLDFDQNMQNLIAVLMPRWMPMIKNITDRTRKMALKNDPENIKYISNPSLEMVKYSMKGSDWVFYNDIENPSAEVLEFLFNEEPFLIFNYLPSQIPADSLRTATLKHVKEQEDGSVYRNLLEWFKELKNRNMDQLMDEEFYEWLVDAWEDKQQDLAVAAVLHNIFLTRKRGKYRRWALDNLIPRFESAREFISDLGIKTD